MGFVSMKSMIKIIFTSLVCIIFYNVIAIADVEKGNAAVQREDYETAVTWFRKSAEQGEALAQYNLGVKYANGQGVAQDYILAHMWFNIGGANGNKKAMENREIIAKKMTRENISKAQKMAREWLGKHQ